MEDKKLECSSFLLYINIMYLKTKSQIKAERPSIVLIKIDLLQMTADDRIQSFSDPLSGEISSPIPSQRSHKPFPFTVN